MSEYLDYYGMFDFSTGDNDTYEYTSDEFSTLIKGLTGNGVSKNDKNEFEATANGLSITIDTGSCFINGRFGNNSSVKTLTLDASGASETRYDKIAIKLDMTARKISLEVIKGTTSAPTLVNTQAVSYLPLYTAKVSNGSTVVLQDERVYTYSACSLQSDLQSIAQILGNCLSVDRGGTGATTAAQALTNLGAAPATHTHGSITTDGKMKNTTNKVLIADANGTIAGAAADTARNLIGAEATISTLPLSKGGTGASNASGAVANLGYAANMVIYSTETPAVVNGKLWLKPST